MMTCFFEECQGSYTAPGVSQLGPAHSQENLENSKKNHWQAYAACYAYYEAIPGTENLDFAGRRANVRTMSFIHDAVSDLTSNEDQGNGGMCA